MNERIKELAVQLGPIATIGNWGRVEWADNVYPQLGDRMYAAIDLQKFAELIVRECIGCCEQVISDPVPKNVDTWLNGGEQCIQEIKEYFGLGMSIEDKKQLIKDLMGVNNDTKS